RISRRSAAKRGVSARTLSLDSGDEQGLCLATDGTSSFHRASNALLALARERRKGAQAEGSPGDRGPRGRAEMADDAAAAGCAGWVAGSGDVMAQGDLTTPARNVPSGVIKAVDPASRNEPSAVAEAGAPNEPSEGLKAVTPGSRNEPSRGIE